MWYRWSYRYRTPHKTQNHGNHVRRYAGRRHVMMYTVLDADDVPRLRLRIETAVESARIGELLCITRRRLNVLAASTADIINNFSADLWSRLASVYRMGNGGTRQTPRRQTSRARCFVIFRYSPSSFSLTLSRIYFTAYNVRVAYITAFSRCLATVSAVS